VERQHRVATLVVKLFQDRNGDGCLRQDRGKELRRLVSFQGPDTAGDHYDTSV
jgi:hypothetical protein